MKGGDILTLRKTYEDFLHEKAVAGLADTTLRDYQYCLVGFLREVEYMEVQDLSYQVVSDYILHLHRSGRSKATVATYVRNIRIWLSWVQAEHGLSFDPKKIKVPKTPKKLVHIYSDVEIRLIFDSVQASVPWITSRNRLMVALMLDSGIRQCEVCGLVWGDVDRDRHIMKVFGKGSKERIVPIGNFSIVLMDEYRFLCPFPGRPYVFCDRHGKQMTGNAVKLFTNRLQRRLPFEFSSHKLRHNFATNYCVDQFHRSGNTGVYDLSIIMGHESIETTKKYEHFAHEILAVESSVSHLDGVYNHIPPLDNKKSGSP